MPTDGYQTLSSGEYRLEGGCVVTGVTIAMSIMYISLTDYGNNLSVRAGQGNGGGILTGRHGGIFPFPVCARLVAGWWPPCRGRRFRCMGRRS